MLTHMQQQIVELLFVRFLIMDVVALVLPLFLFLALIFSSSKIIQMVGVLLQQVAQLQYALNVQAPLRILLLTLFKLMVLL